MLSFHFRFTEKLRYELDYKKRALTRLQETYNFREKVIYKRIEKHAGTLQLTIILVLRLKHDKLT